MARVPATQGEGEVAERIRARRQGVLRPIDTVLLHSPDLADGWNVFLGAIRTADDLPADLRELVVMRIAVLNDAPYEWSSHERDAEVAGLTADHLAALRRPDAATADVLEERQRAVVRLTDAMTRDIEVSDELFDALADLLELPAIVALTVTIAAYNMVSRLVVAMQVEAPSASGVA